MKYFHYPQGRAGKTPFLPHQGKRDKSKAKGQTLSKSQSPLKSQSPEASHCKLIKSVRLSDPPGGGRRAAHPVMSQNSYHSISIVLDLTKESEASFELQGHTAQGSDTGDTVGNGGLPRCHGGRPTRFHHIQHEQLSLALLPTCTPHHCQRKRHG